jgi:hypothetical protein
MPVAEGVRVPDGFALTARAYRDTGVGGGNRVALWGSNSAIWIVATLAVLAAGSPGSGRRGRDDGMGRRMKLRWINVPPKAHAHGTRG